VKAVADFLFFKFVPRSTDAGLLALRLLIGGSLFIKHGWEKLSNFPGMAAHFQDPIHIGPVPSLVIALIADGICSILVMAGLLTRWAALFAAVNVGVAWGLVHHFAYFSKQQGDHGELCVLYIIALFAVFLSGPGRFSIDEWIRRDRRHVAEKKRI
jgi:putative oxidoreductase